MRRAHSSSGEVLTSAEFTKFMGNLHDQNQEEIKTVTFAVPEGMKEEIEQSIRRVRSNKAP